MGCPHDRASVSLRKRANGSGDRPGFFFIIFIYSIAQKNETVNGTWGNLLSVRKANLKFYAGGDFLFAENDNRRV